MIDLRQKEKTCEEACCRRGGFKSEPLPNGDRFVSARLRHDGEYHIRGFKLAETTVALIKRDSKFREYFQELMNA